MDSIQPVDEFQRYLDKQNLSLELAGKLLGKGQKFFDYIIKTSIVKLS